MKEKLSYTNLANARRSNFFIISRVSERQKKWEGGVARSPVAANRNKNGMGRASAQEERNVQRVQRHAS